MALGWNWWLQEPAKPRVICHVGVVPEAMCRMASVGDPGLHGQAHLGSEVLPAMS